mgnify:CR=1 FL=1
MTIYSKLKDKLSPTRDKQDALLMPAHMLQGPCILDQVLSSHSDLDGDRAGSSESDCHHPHNQALNESESESNCDSSFSSAVDNTTSTAEETTLTETQTADDDDNNGDPHDDGNSGGDDAEMVIDDRQPVEGTVGARAINFDSYVPLVPPPHLNLPIVNPPEGFHHMLDNQGDDMYAVERVPMGRFQAEQNGMYEHDPLADEIPVFAIFEANAEQELQDAADMVDDMERLMRELEEVD